MIVCPHCNQPVDVNPNVTVAWWRRDLTPGLGCGSLLAIAVIVTLCSGGVRSSHEINDLRSEIQSLAKKVDALTATRQTDPIAAAPEAAP
jgi:outer membrane murein-binding lipoprotein Lpp